MNAEDYVSYEVAKLLKEKGYNHYEKQHYFTEDIHVGDGTTIKGKSLTEMFHLWDDFNDFKIYAPSLWDAAKWLREEHQVDVISRLEFDDEDYGYGKDICIGYGFDIYKDKELVDFSIGFDTYEQALNEGISRALNLI